MKRDRITRPFLGALVISTLTLVQTVFCQTWEGPQIIDAATGHGANSPGIAFGGSGDAFAVFSQSDGTSQNIYAHYYDPGFGWTGSTMISAGGSNAALPDIAVNTDGSAYAVFIQQSGPGFPSYATRFTAGGGWTAQQSIASGANISNHPRVATDDNGNAAAVFQEWIGSTAIYANIYNPASGWGTAAQIDTASGNEAEDPRVAYAPDGSILAVFRQSDGAAYNIYKNRYIPGTGWTGTLMISDGAALDTDEPQLAIDSDGNAIVVYEQVDPTAVAGQIYAVRFDAAGGWGLPERIDDTSGGMGENPRIAFDTDGNAVAVFEQLDGTLKRVRANRYTAGSGWGTPEIIDANTGSDAESPRIAIDGGNNARAVFVQGDGTYNRIYATRDSSGTWNTPDEIDAETGYDASMPRIACDGDGNAFAVFKQSDGSYERIYANYFTAPVTPTPTPTPPIDLTPDKTTFSTTDTIRVTAAVQPIGTRFYPVVRIITPNGRTLYYTRGKGFSASPRPYLSGGPYITRSAINGYVVMDVAFAGVATGTYYLEGAAVDATQTTSVNNLVYIGGIDRETLTVQ
jgi:hypothetical protein